MKSLGFFSSWVLKLQEVNTIYEVYHYKNVRGAMQKESGFLSKQQQTEEAGYKVLLACLYCIASQQLLSKCSLPHLMALMPLQMALYQMQTGHLKTSHLSDRCLFS